MRCGAGVAVVLMAGGWLAGYVAPAAAFGPDAHDTLTRAALARLPADLRTALAAHEAMLLQGVAEAVAADHGDRPQSAAAGDRVEAVVRRVERLRILGGDATPFLAHALGGVAVELAHIAQPYGLADDTTAPAFVSAYRTLLDTAVAGGVAPRPLPTFPHDVSAAVEDAWEQAAARQALVRADAARDFPSRSASVTSAGMVANGAVEAIAQVFRYVLTPAASTEVADAHLLSASLAQVRFGAREQAWTDVEHGLRRLADAGYRIPLSPGNVGREFFTMHERGADCALYRLALEVHAANARLKTAAAACAKPAPPPPTAELPPLPALSSAKETGIRAFRHRRGHVLLTNRADAVGDDYIPLNFEPIRPYTPAAPVAAPFDLEAVVQFYAGTYNLDSALVKAVIQTESDFDPHVVSRAGARGLMQLMPSTALDMGVEDIFDPVQNIAGGTQYLAKMLELFDDDLTLALAAYNAGPGTVRRYGGVPPYEETERYVPLVVARANAFRRNGGAVALRGDTVRPDAAYLPEPDVPEHGAVVFLRNGLTMRGLQAVDVERGVRLEMETGWILVPTRNIERVARAAG